MKDSIIKELAKLHPIHTEGRVRIDLTDPISGKVENRVNGKNMVFSDSLLCGPSGSDWMGSISATWLCLNDSDAPLDSTLPLLFGQTLGYGRPSLGSNGVYRGAYNAANQVLAAMDTTKVRWKFQYDFTTAQANGVIKNAGLTHQYIFSNYRSPTLGFNKGTLAGTNKGVSDGRYSYLISTSGVITKFDWWTGATTTIDVSLTVGTSSANYKSVGYAPMTGKYYVFVSSSTAASRKMYQFSSADFSNLESTYSPSNLAWMISDTLPFYVYGNKAYMFTSSLNTLFISDFAANAAYTTQTVATYNNAAYSESTYTKDAQFYSGTMGKGKYVIVMCTAIYNYSKGIIYDMSTESVVGYVVPSVSSTNGSYQVGTYQYPLGNNKLIMSNNGTPYNNSALTSWLLPAPFTKTSANGMTATYELEVYW